MARGYMVRYLAENSIEIPEEIKSYNRCCYQFDESRSNDSEYVFIRMSVPGKLKYADFRLPED